MELFELSHPTVLLSKLNGRRSGYVIGLSSKTQGYEAALQQLSAPHWTTSMLSSVLLIIDGRGKMRPLARLKPWRHVRVQVRTYAAAPTGPAVRAIDHPAPHTGSIRVLLLDQPHNKNALSRRLCNELRQHIDEVKANAGSNTTRAVVIASNIDKVFCAGADLKERKTMSQAEYASPVTGTPMCAVSNQEQDH